MSLAVRRLKRLVNVIVLLAFTPLSAQQLPVSQNESLTPERILSQPSLNGELLWKLHWSSDSSRLAWLQSSPPAPAKAQHPPGAPLSSGVDIWSVDTATGKPGRLVSADQIAAALASSAPSRSKSDDDRPGSPPQLTDYAWSPDARALLLITPVSLVWFEFESGRAHSLVTGSEELSSAQISPDGRYVSFVRDHALWLTVISTRTARRITPPGSIDLHEGEPDWPYRNELALRTAYWWSPDSSRIAYLETDDRATGKYSLRSADGRERAIAYPLPGTPLPVVHLFVQPVAGGERRAVDLGHADYLPRVNWTPDSRHLAVERLSRDQKVLDLLLADPAPGKSRVILSDKDSYWINLADGPRFLRDSKRFLWSSERTGYRHLYLYDTDGHQLAQLTSGDWEVTSLDALDETAGQVYFTSTQSSTPSLPGTERHVYRVNLNGSSLTVITPQKGTHEAFFSPDSRFFVDTFSTVETSPRQDLLHADGKPLATLNGNAVPALAAFRLPPVEFLSVKTHMDTDLNALMIRPPNFDASHKYPAIVYIDGGPGEQVVRDKWGGDTFLWLRMMAQKGYVIYAQDGRGAAGRGHLFEEPLHLRLSSLEMADQRDGVRYLRSLPFIDPARVGIYGWGYGGFLVLHAMLDKPIAYKAGIAGAPVTDWRLYDAVFSERYLEDPVRNQDGYLDSMPTENAKNLTGSLLIVQGTTDERVHIENSLVLLNEFLETAKYPSVMFFPDRGHIFEDHEARLALYRAMTEFFLKNL
jgi:dipeptidyl-peptidase-4